MLDDAFKLTLDVVYPPIKNIQGRDDLDYE